MPFGFNHASVGLFPNMGVRVKRGVDTGMEVPPSPGAKSGKERGVREGDCIAVFRR